MCLAQGPQRSDAGEARTRGPSVSSDLDNVNLFPKLLLAGKELMPLAMSLNLCNGIGPQGFFSFYRELLHPDMKKKSIKL